MHSVNDDMDDLWRKAGNEYPLNSDGADWDKVAAKLGIPPAPKRRDRRYLWLLLLLLIPVICVRPFPLGIGSDEKAPTAQESTAPLQHRAAPALPGQTTRTARPAATPGTDRAAAMDSAGTANRSSTDAAPSTTPIPVSPAVATRPPIAGGAPSGRRSGNNAPSRRARAASSRQPAASAPVAATAHRDPAQPRQHNADNDLQQADAGSVAAPDAFAPAPVQPPAPGKDAATQQRAIAAADPVDTTPAATPAAAKKPAAKASRVYAGVVAGAGITTVKGQKVEAPGYDLGVAIGFQAGRHLAVEAQLLWSRKHYYSSGVYVGKSPGYMPQYSSIKSVDGDCRMFEIPVVLRYDFHLRQRGSWFASAGVSSYLMKREEYGYVLHYGMTNYDGYHDTTFRNASRDWAAVLQLSAGYRLALPRSYSLRFEPYVQVPLRNAGAGSLPLTSAGLRLLFSRPLGGKEPRR
ncbi:porin family protein [Flaviaesturariibacter terrae]